MQEYSYVLKGRPHNKISPIKINSGFNSTDKSVYIISRFNLGEQHGEVGLLEGVLEMDIRFYIKTPSSLSRQRDYPVHYAVPTILDLCEFIKQAMVGVVIKDIHHVISLNACKLYDPTERTEIQIRVIDEKTKNNITK